MTSVSVIIPALNEEEPIAGVVRECFATNIPSEIIVVDNGSTDRTAERGHEAGAKVVSHGPKMPGRGVWVPASAGTTRGECRCPTL